MKDRSRMKSLAFLFACAMCTGGCEQELYLTGFVKKSIFKVPADGRITAEFDKK